MILMYEMLMNDDAHKNHDGMHHEKEAGYNPNTSLK